MEASNRLEQPPRTNSHNGGEPSVSISAEISRGMVRLYKEHMGRGPTKARTTINGDHVICVLRDSLTEPERKLAATERGPELVNGVRTAFQEKMKSDAVAMIETMLQREVIAFLSDHDVEPDIACEVFILAPLPDTD